jgi:hypothetical protein
VEGGKVVVAQAPLSPQGDVEGAGSMALRENELVAFAQDVTEQCREDIEAAEVTAEMADTRSAMHEQQATTHGGRIKGTSRHSTATSRRAVTV